MKHKIYKKSFITKFALDNFQRNQVKAKSIIVCGIYCSKQNEACNAIIYEKDSLDCSMWLLDLMYCNHPEFTSNFEKQDGQDDQLIDIFLGDELMDIQCPPQGKYAHLLSSFQNVPGN